MRLLGLPLLITALMLAAGPASAIAGTHKVALREEYLELNAGGNVTLVSGKFAANGPASGAFLFRNASYALTGLEQVCWDFSDLDNGCAEGPGLSIHVSGGSDSALRFPAPVQLRAEAGYALATFIDLSSEPSLEDMFFEPSIVAPVVDSLVAITEVPAIPAVEPKLVYQPRKIAREAGGVAPLNDHSFVEVRQNGSRVILVQGGDDVRVGFTGKPVVNSIRADAWALPSGNLTSSFRPAKIADVRQGLNMERVNNLRDFLSGNWQSQPPETGQAGELESLLQEVLNGALFHLPIENTTGTNAFLRSVFVRFSSLQASDDAGTIKLQGRAALEFRDGNVQETMPLYGFWLIQLPWWGWLLWAVAIGAAITRFVLKSPKTNERWSGLWWIGWVALIPVALLVFWLWDRELARLLGTSVLSTASSGAGYGAVWLVQMATLALAVTLFFVPTQMLLRNGLMLGRQGKFMNLSMPVSLLIAFLLGAVALLAYMGLLLPKVIEGLAQ
jgi:hypothetical protein